MGAMNIKNIDIDGTHAIFLLPGGVGGAIFQPRWYQIYPLCAHPDAWGQGRASHITDAEVRRGGGMGTESQNADPISRDVQKAGISGTT